MDDAIAGRAEWRAHWALPFVAAIGYSTAGIHTYMLGPLMAPLHAEFGWTRVQVTAGLALVNAFSVVGSPLIGALVDRIGPRRIALAGVLLLPAAIGLFGTATGSMGNWMGLWALEAFCFLGVNGTVWTSAVASRFQAARGTALAIALSGASVTAAAVPLLATSLIAHFGWRAALGWMGGIWALVAFPLMLLFFRGAQDERGADRGETRAAAERLPGLQLREAFRAPAFYKLLIVGLLFAICILGSAVHFVPLLVGAGASPMRAASAASMIGIFSIVGRLGTGALLDRFPGHIVGAGATLIPVIGAAMLLWGGGGAVGYFTAAAAFGLTLGSEMDLISYLSARHFGLKKYGVILGVMMGAIALGGVVGPLAAGATYDRFGDYAPFLMAMIVMMLAAAALIATLRPPPEWPAPA